MTNIEREIDLATAYVRRVLAAELRLDEEKRRNSDIYQWISAYEGYLRDKFNIKDPIKEVKDFYSEKGIGLPRR